MPVEYVSGDLFTSNAQALAHGCNCQGVMGAGIAVQFKKRYPEMFRQYQHICQVKSFIPGAFYRYKAPDDRLIYNLATQVYPGAHARIEWVSACLQSMVGLHSSEFGPVNSSIAIPRIGCGLGGLLWPDVKKVIEDVGNSTTVKLVVYSY